MLVVSLMNVYLDELRADTALLADANIGKHEGPTMGEWFAEVTALIILLPIPIAIVTTVVEVVYPEYRDWRDACESDPAFPPSFRQYLMYGQTSSLPGHERLTAAVPGKWHRQLDAIEVRSAGHLPFANRFRSPTRHHHHASRFQQTACASVSAGPPLDFPLAS